MVRGGHRPTGRRQLEAVEHRRLRRHGLVAAPGPVERRWAFSLRAVKRPSAQPAPVPPTTAAGRAAASLRRSAGAQLSQNPRIEVDAQDRARLLAGEVDIRIVLVLAQFATTHSVAVRDFGVASGDTSGVRTSMTIGSVDGRAVPSDGTKTGVVLRFLSGLHGQFATESIDANDEGITVRFTPRPDLVPLN
jgi:hypothetical protein